MAITLDGTNGISAPNVYGRNLIINGSGRINQRGYTSGTATSGANEYMLDRWRVVTSGQNLSFTGNDAGRVMTAPAGGAEQVIEGANIAGGTYVLNWTGTATATVDGASVSKGGTFTLTANTNATVRFTGGTFSEVQLEPGSVATPFEFRSIGQELVLCQRYYEIIPVARCTGVTYTPNGDTRGGEVNCAVAKRTTPTVSYTGSANVIAVGNAGDIINVSLGTFTFAAYGVNRIAITGISNYAAFSSAGSVISWGDNGGGSLTYYADAEL